jgi:stage VI sporulation protein D
MNGTIIVWEIFTKQVFYRKLGRCLRSKFSIENSKGGYGMTENKTGLRFDIYERVHLSDELPAMKSLDSIELIPNIQVMAEGEQALLKGNLRLSGQYFSENEDETLSLEHWIPVEITLPLNRVQKLEDIAVEIENFDIDLLSSRLLNITGVLSLQGLDTIPAAKDWQEEQLQFSEDAEDVRLAEPYLVPSDPNDETYPNLDTIVDDGTRLENVEAIEEKEAGRLEEVPGGVLEAERIQTETAVPETAVNEEKKELKVAFGSKSNEVTEQISNMKNLLKPEEKNQDSSYLPDINRDTNTDAGREGVRGDELEWKKLFLGERGNERQFQKVRLCIVQKEETMDGIAERYHIHPREIMQFNRLNSYQVAAGQAIYIPS